MNPLNLVKLVLQLSRECPEYKRKIKVGWAGRRQKGPQGQILWSVVLWVGVSALSSGHREPQPRRVLGRE